MTTLKILIQILLNSNDNGTGVSRAYYPSKLTQDSLFALGTILWAKSLTVFSDRQKCLNTIAHSNCSTQS